MIDVTPMTNADNLDPQRIVFDCIDDTVIANTNAVCMLGAFESDDALRKGVGSQRINSRNDARNDISRQTL